MYYILYLSSLCQRRKWPDPLYESYRTSSGYACTVRVNNREYQTDTLYESDTLARENAAMRAYLICRNFSVNDGMYPAGHNKGGVVQGLPVAIGTGRRTSAYVDDYGRGSGSSSNSSTSESSSPASSDNGKEMGERSRGGGLSRALAYGSCSRRM